jgi:hypothetical protein
MPRVKALTAASRAVQNFKKEFNVFVALFTNLTAREPLRVYVEDPALQPQRQVVDEAAGRVQAALDGLGLNPGNIIDWRAAFRRGGSMRVADVTGDCDTLLGQLGQLVDSTRASERTAAGRVARVVRFPYEVRDLADLSGRPGTIAVGAVSTILLGAATIVLAAVAIGLLKLAGVPT